MIDSQPNKQLLLVSSHHLPPSSPLPFSVCTTPASNNGQPPGFPSHWPPFLCRRRLARCVARLGHALRPNPLPGPGPRRCQHRNPLRIHLTARMRPAFQFDRPRHALAASSQPPTCISYIQKTKTRRLTHVALPFIPPTRRANSCLSFPRSTSAAAAAILSATSTCQGRCRRERCVLHTCYMFMLMPLYRIDDVFSSMAWVVDVL
ncbi:hypothetical protein R3P38DRAFT_3270723 [Favolaschia claudopus]|uniref:Uncharacterized protein n=1 Tax=Favolaschia claudopus TaxID=2862362 RepID=A0AAW0BAS0_9AGAR